MHVQRNRGSLDYWYRGRDLIVSFSQSWVGIAPRSGFGYGAHGCRLSLHALRVLVQRDSSFEALPLGLGDVVSVAP